MQPSLKEYTEMAENLTQNGFTDQQSRSLVQLIAEVFSRIESYFERIRQEDQADRERIRREDKEERERIRQEDQTDRERIRREDKEERERIRQEDKADRERYSRESKEQHARFETRIEAKMDAYHQQSLRFSLVTLSTLLLSVVGAMVIYALQAIK